MIKSILFSPPPAAWRHDWVPAAVLAVRGEDALVFLQGQFSQDLRAPGVSRLAYGLWLNHKGRVQADSFALVISPAEVWLISYFSPADALRQHLESHIIADDVTVEDQTATWTGLTVGGADAAKWLQQQDAEQTALPAVGHFGAWGRGFCFRGRRGADESWEWLAPLPSPFPPVGEDRPEISALALAQLRVAALFPAVPADLGPADLPPEGGLDAAAISYTKGCFLGQEVMARLRTGKIRRRLLLVAGSGAPMAALPAPLFQFERRVGELRSAVPDGAGGFIGLAMLTLLNLEVAQPLAFGVTESAPGTLRLLDAP